MAAVCGIVERVSLDNKRIPGGESMPTLEEKVCKGLRATTFYKTAYKGIMAESSTNISNVFDDFLRHF